MGGDGEFQPAQSFIQLQPTEEQVTTVVLRGALLGELDKPWQDGKRWEEDEGGEEDEEEKPSGSVATWTRCFHHSFSASL